MSARESSATAFGAGAHAATPSARKSNRLDDPQVIRRVQQYHEALEAGQRPSVAQLLDEFPEIANELAGCLEGLRFVHEAAPQLCGQVEPGRQRLAGADELHAIGQLGDYRIVREIGHGGMGVVYEAEQISLGRRVALKVLPFAAMLDERQLKRFKNEARAAATLEHPNIVPVHAIGCERAVHFFAMSLVHGQTLAEVIAELRRSQSAREAEADKGRQGDRETPSPRPVRDQCAGSLPKTEPTDHPVGARIAMSDRSDRSDKSDKSDMSDTSDMSDQSDQSDNNIRPEPDATSPYPPTPTPIPPPAAETHKEIQAAISTDQPTQTPAFFRTVAKLAIQAAEALDHAHSHGIIHRDIKPANLMLDTTGKLWITDFGLARIESDAGMTMTGDIVGTIRYMSPEQALAKRVVVDHRADIYSLGVSFYELLTLRPAFDGADRQVLLKQIAFEEPRAPRRINKAIPRELELIILKAMSKNPDERFATAQEMADDLGRFLDDKPIVAKPPSLLQRAAKWSRRHRPLVGSAAVILLLAIVGLAISNVLIAHQRDRAETAVASEKRERAEAQRHRAEAQRQRDRAERLRQAEQRRREEAEEQRREADRQRQLAQENFRRAREAVDKYLTKVSETELLNVSGLQPLRKDLLELALEYYKGFIAERGNDPTLRAELAAAYFRVGDVTSEIGSANESLQAHQRALEIRKKLVAGKPDSPEYRSDLAKSYESVAGLQCETGKLQGALGSCQGAIGIREKLVAEIPDIAAYRNDLGGAYHHLGAVHFYSRRGEEAIAALRTAVEIRGRVVSENPNDLDFSFDLAASLIDLGRFSYELGNPEQSLASWEKAIEILEKLKDRAPPAAKYQNLLAGCYNNLAACHQDSDEKVKWYERAIAIQEQVVQQNQSVGKYQHALAVTLGNVGRQLCGAGKTEEAIAHLLKAFEIRLELIKNDPRPYYLSYFVEGCFAFDRLAGPNTPSETNEKILACYRQAITLIEQMSLKKPSFAHNPSELTDTIQDEAAERNQIVWRGLLSVVYCCLGQAETKLQKKDKALASLEQSSKIRDELVDKDPNVFKGDGNMREMFYSSRIDLFACLEKWDEALREYDRWLEVDPRCSKPYAQRGVMLSGLKRYEEALRDWAKAIELDLKDTHGCRSCSHSNRIDLFTRLEKWDQALQECRKWLEAHPDWSAIYTRRGVMVSKIKRYDEALRDWAKAIELDPENAEGCRSASHGNRIVAYADMGQWDKALAECEEAFKAKGNAKDPWLSYVSALANLEAGHGDVYRTRCAAMLEQFCHSENVEAAHWTAWTCSLSPDAVADPASLVALARRAAEKDAKSLSYLNSLGAALYRAGEFEEAVRRLEQIDELVKGSNSDEHSSPAYAWYLLAMARHRLGNKEEATKWLNKAVERTDRALDEHKREGGERLSWNRRVTLELLRHEAEELLKGDTERERPKAQPKEPPKTP